MVFLLEKGENLIKNEYYNISFEEFNYKEEKKDNKIYKCFVIMPIGKVDTIEYKNNIDVYEKIIKPCVENGSYHIECYYADLIKKTGDISGQVFESLYNDDIVIADLRRNNPNVIYELGIRHTFGKRSILICSDFIQNFFHTTKYRAIKYNIDGKSNQDFYQKLTKHIEDIIEHPKKSDNPVTDTLLYWKIYIDK